MFGKTSNELVCYKGVHIVTEFFYVVSCIDPSVEESWFFDSGSCLAMDGLD